MSMILMEDEIAKLEEAFNEHDTDADGVITVTEVESVLKTLGHTLSESEVSDMVVEYDPHDTGTINLPDFIDMMSLYTKYLVDDTFKEGFQLFDLDGDGFISQDEVRRIRDHLGETTSDAEIEEMFDEADTNKDGLISYIEFVRMMLK
ncbi:calmodulin, striated muscle-like [Saccoglossus kowalevskii]|uniref:Calmodulin-like n=1 Tax=Saccoglossus kowalevskii TaxID=10224 RepID=A0ABM0GWH1_SACKO|nr:PREDICTED: calmodulin-like [Saccoglossus kowalevskii]